MMTLRETLILSVAAIFLLWVLSIWGWRGLLSRDPDLRNKTSACISVLTWPALILLLVAILVAVFLDDLMRLLIFNGFMLAFVFLIMVPAVVLLAVVIPILVWTRFGRNYRNPDQASVLRKRCLLAASGIFPLAWLPFLLWAYGIVSDYELAKSASAIVAFAVFIGGMISMDKLLRQESEVIT